MRVIASKIELGEDAASADPSSGGVKAKVARSLDIRVAEISDGCVKLGMDVVAGDCVQLVLPAADVLEERATIAFLTHVQEHGKGVKPHKSVAKYLERLRDLVDVHEYSARRSDGSELVPAFTLGRVPEYDVPKAFPYLVAVRGAVAGVVFEPDKTQVWIHDETGSYGTCRCSATPEQVDEALRLHALGSVVEARVLVDGERRRIFSLRDAASPRRVMDADARSERIFARWSGLLAELAK